VTDRERLARFVNLKLRSAGRTLAKAERAYRSGRRTSSLPTNEDGRARIVCRRFAERRSVELDDSGRPHCFDPDHPDCQGCVEDIDDGAIETWAPEDLEDAKR
jgi:hypothetical protein